MHLSPCLPWAARRPPQVTPYLSVGLYYGHILVYGAILAADLLQGPGAAGDLTLALSNDHLAVTAGGELWRLVTCIFGEHGGACCTCMPAQAAQAPVRRLRAAGAAPTTPCALHAVRVAPTAPRPHCCSRHSRRRRRLCCAAVHGTPINLFITLFGMLCLAVEYEKCVGMFNFFLTGEWLVGAGAAL